jgi:hypothetical protein
MGEWILSIGKAVFLESWCRGQRIVYSREYWIMNLTRRKIFKTNKMIDSPKKNGTEQTTVSKPSG